MRLVLRIALAVEVAFSGVASAQGTYPSKPIRLVGPFVSGGILDLMARTINEKVGTLLGQPVIVEARPGADGSIGTDFVARAAPDGYTLLFAGLPHVTLPALFNTPWHPTKDFAGIATVSHVANLVVVPTSVSARSLADFVSYARGRGADINSLNGGTAGPQNLNTELFKKAAGIKMTPVGYKGLVSGVPDLLNGSLHFAIMPYALVDAHIKAGKLTPLAVTSEKRIKQYPDVPTMAEAGYPEASVLGWYAVLAPAGTPRNIIGQLNAVVNQALADPDVIARIEKLNAEPLPGSRPEAVDAMLRKETDRWQRLAKEANLRIK